MGHDLTIAQGPRIDAARTRRDRVAAPRDHVAAQVVGRGTDGDRGAPVAAEVVASGDALAIVDVSWSAVAVDPERTIATLRAERSATRGGFDHPHAVSDCPFCRRAAASYR